VFENEHSGLGCVDNGRIAELDAGEALERGRVRRPGGGRKRITEKDPTLVADLERLLEADVRGDPERPLRWSSKSGAKLAGGLRGAGHQVADRTVLKTLKELGIACRPTARRRRAPRIPTATRSSGISMRQRKRRSPRVSR